MTFLAIHPFQDGNGRLSRVLTTLLILRAGYAYVPYASLERVLEETKTCITRRSGTQATLRGDLPDCEPRVGFFLRSLKKQKDSLAVRLGREQIAQDGENELSAVSRQVIKALRAQERLTITQLASITGANRNTLKVPMRVAQEFGLPMHRRDQGKLFCQPILPAMLAPLPQRPISTNLRLE